MENLMPCPCGKIPTALHIVSVGNCSKYAYVSGNCCNEWNIEFRTFYKNINSDECMAYAVSEWNCAQRANKLGEK